MRPFAVLGLGSTLYPDLCAASVALNAKLERYGLERLCPLAKVDQAAGTNEAISVLVGLAVKLAPPQARTRDAGYARLALLRPAYVCLQMARGRGYG